jgi:signal transduction histidine kinase
VIQTKKKGRVPSRKRRAEELRNIRMGQLRALLARQDASWEAERAAVAREIHDELGQVLVAVKVECASLSRAANGLNEEGREHLVHAISLVDRGMRCVRRLCAELRPAVLDNLGLAAAIEWQVEEFAFRTGIPCHLGRLQDTALSVERSAAMFRIFQDMLRNVADYAVEHRIEVSLWRRFGLVVLSVRDDGSGAWTSGIASLGLLGIRERTEALDGYLLVEGGRGEGTRLTVVVPQKAGLIKVGQSHENPISGRSRGRAARA